MKFTILKSAFLDGLKAVQNVVPSKGAMPVLQNVLIESEEKSVKITTTDIEISINTVCECEVKESGSTTLPVKLLFNIISKLPDGEINISVDENDVASITAVNSKVKISGISATSFPKLPISNDEHTYVLPQATLKEMLRKVSYAAAQDDTRKTLTGVLMSFKDSKLTMVATDGRRLAMVENEVEVNADAEREMVLPVKLVGELQRTLLGEGEVTIMHKGSQVCFNIGNVKIYSKLIDEIYPNYRQVIPNNTMEKIMVDRQMLLEAIDRASVMTADTNLSIKLSFTNGMLTVASAASDKGESKDEVPIKYAGEEIEIVFNPNYVMDVLRVIDDDEISINLNNGHSPAVIRCSVPFLYVLMPLRIS